VAHKFATTYFCAVINDGDVLCWSEALVRLDHATGCREHSKIMKLHWG